MAWVDEAGRKLVVTGQVCVSDEDVRVALRPRRPQGVNPRVLLLEISSPSAAASGSSQVWKHAHVEIAVDSPPQDQVVVFDGERVVADIGVVRPS